MGTVVGQERWNVSTVPVLRAAVEAFRGRDGEALVMSIGAAVGRGAHSPGGLGPASQRAAAARLQAGGDPCYISCVGGAESDGGRLER